MAKLLAHGGATELMFRFGVVYPVNLHSSNFLASISDTAL